MEIVVKQIRSDLKNEFEVLVDKKKEYLATTPVLDMEGLILKIDKKLPIKIESVDGKKTLESEYAAVDNLKEEYIPFKYLATKEQKFNQFTFKNNEEKVHCKIYFAQQEYLKGNYVIKQNDKYFEGYAKNTGYYANVSIYDGDKQIAEIIKLNVIQDGNDTYTIFLKDEYKSLAETLIAFTLYIDRLYFNYGFTKKSTYIEYSKTYSKNDDKYNPNWVKENFDTTSFYNECEKIIEESKSKVVKVFIIVGILIVISILLALAIIKFLK